MTSFKSDWVGIQYSSNDMDNMNIAIVALPITSIFNNDSIA